MTFRICSIRSGIASYKSSVGNNTNYNSISSTNTFHFPFITQPQLFNKSGIFALYSEKKLADVLKVITASVINVMLRIYQRNKQHNENTAFALRSLLWTFLKKTIIITFPFIVILCQSEPHHCMPNLIL